MPKNIHIPFVDISTDVPLIKLKIGDYETTAVIDTGAESTVLGQDILKHCRYKDISDVETNFVGIAGNVSENTKHISIEAEADGSTFEIEGYVSDIGFIGEHFIKWCNYDTPISIILGSDMLAQYNAILNFEKRVFKIKQ